MQQQISVITRDSRRAGSTPGAFSLAHSVLTRDAVQPHLDQPVSVGGNRLRPADAPPHDGIRGHIADRDGRAWESAWNPSSPSDAVGHVTFGI